MFVYLSTYLKFLCGNSYFLMIVNGDDVELTTSFSRMMRKRYGVGQKLKGAGTNASGEGKVKKEEEEDARVNRATLFHSVLFLFTPCKNDDEFLRVTTNKTCYSL